MFQRLTIALLVVCAVCVPAPEASQDSAQSPDEVLSEAREIYAQEGPRAALPEYEKALALYREAGDGRGEAITLGYIGNCHKRFGDFRLALEYLNRALSMKQELGERLEQGKTLSHLGLVYWEMGEYPQAIDYFTRSIEIAREVGDRKLEGSALNNLSLVYDEQGDYQRSLEQYEQVLELYRGIDFPRGESDTLGNIGGVYLLLGQYRKAAEQYQQALAISKRLGLKPSMSQDLGNLAWCQLGLGDIDAALANFDLALPLARDSGLNKETADWLRGKGKAYLRLGRYDPAMEMYREALQSYEKAGLKRELVEALNKIGILYVLLGDVASGEKSFRRAIKVARGIDHPWGVTFNLMSLGDLERRRERYEEAAALYREALSRAREAGDRVYTAESLLRLALIYRDQDRLDEAAAQAAEALKVAREIEASLLGAGALYALGEIERHRGNLGTALEHYASAESIVEPVGDPDLLWHLHYGRGQALESMGRDREAVEALERAVTVIEGVRSRLREERFRSGYIEDKYQVYVALVRLLLKLDRTSDAFSSSERLRARSYLDLFNRGPSLMANDAQRKEEIELRERIRQLQQVIEEETAKPRPQQRRQAIELFSRELGEAERSYQNLLDDLRSSDPAYAAARALEVLSTETLQRLLPRGTALLEYVIAEDDFVVFAVTADRLRAKTVSLRRADLRAKVELFRDLVLRTESEAWRKPAMSLADSLIRPVERAGWLEGIERLYIVPHGFLHYLPFAALPRQTEDGIRFLVEDYVLAYLPSASSLVHRPEARSSERNLLALAPARARLRHAPEEVRSIREFFPERHTVFVGARATEGAFKQRAGDYRVLHLATHGYFNKINPLLSGLELEPSAGQDGRLEVHEILNLRLDADLVSLSACETALGSGYFADVPAGDDFVSLTRAFLFAGSDSVLASLWEVNDRSTLRLMREFYEKLSLSGKAAALAQVQRSSIRNDGQNRHPYYWAPFALAGSMN